MTPTPLQGEPGAVLPMPGLEIDNLLSFLALLGLLRALEEARPDWRAAACWAGPPWRAQLHTCVAVDQTQVAAEASKGLEAIAKRLDVGGRSDVRFTVAEYRAFAQQHRDDPVGAALVAALAAERPENESGGLRAAPLVMMFGQGHQHFLDRLVTVSRGELPSRLKKLKSPPNLADPEKIAQCLFQPWVRQDDADGFRWDPEEDQRYALRFGDPSASGAALTVHGANRLATIGFLSFACAPGKGRATVRGAARDEDGWSFVWPVWTVPLTRQAIERLLSHDDVLAGRLDRVRAYGVAEILCARRIANNKYMNVTRATPVQRAREVAFQARSTIRIPVNTHPAAPNGGGP